MGNQPSKKEEISNNPNPSDKQTEQIDPSDKQTEQIDPSNIQTEQTDPNPSDKQNELIGPDWITNLPEKKTEKNDFDCDYDLEVQIESLQSLQNTGWNINFGPNAEDVEKEDLMFVGVMGLYNRGKTYVLNRLANTNLKEGYDIHTSGISFKHPRKVGVGQKYMLVDIAGFNSPLPDLKDDAVEAQFQKDRVIQEIILRLCYTFVVVVNDITLEDQLFIANLQSAVQTLKRNNRHGSKFDDIIVIHNFSKITETDLMLRAFEEQVVRISSGRWDEQYLGVDQPLKYYYTPPTEPGRNPSKKESGVSIGIRHVPMLKDDSKEAKSHNQQMISLITSWLQAMSYKMKATLTQLFMTYAEEVLANYLLRPRKLISNFDSKPCCIKMTNLEEGEVELAKESKGSFFKRQVFVPRYFIPPPETLILTEHVESFKYDILTDNQDNVRVIVEFPGILPKMKYQSLIEKIKPFEEGADEKGEKKKIEDEKDIFFFERSTVSEKWDPSKGELSITCIKEKSAAYKDAKVRNSIQCRNFDRATYVVRIRDALPGDPSLSAPKKYISDSGIVVYNLKIIRGGDVEDDE